PYGRTGLSCYVCVAMSAPTCVPCFAFPVMLLGAAGDRPSSVDPQTYEYTLGWSRARHAPAAPARISDQRPRRADGSRTNAATRARADWFPALAQRTAVSW